MKTIPLIATAALLLAAATPRLSAAAAESWATSCKACHGLDGAGHTKIASRLGVKDLTDAAYQKTFTDDAAFNDLKNGLVKDGHTKMKPFADKFSDDEIKALVAYVRTLAK
jgi:cytochrome c553